MVNNPYAVEEFTRQHQAELEREAARSALARSARAGSWTMAIRSLFAGLAAGLRHRRAEAAVRLGAHRATRHLHLLPRHGNAVRMGDGGK